MAKPFTSRPAAAASASSTFSVLSADTRVTGDIEASADLHVDGTVDGNITCHALVQGEGSTISGDIRAETIRIAGKVCGTVAAREVVILKTARIEGDVAYDALTIEQGASLAGRLTPNGGQIPPAIAQNEPALLLAKAN